MTRYSVEPRTRKYVKGYGFLFFAKNLNELRQVALNGILLSKLLKWFNYIKVCDKNGLK